MATPRGAHSGPRAAPVGAPAHCRSREFADGALGADPSCTPGALNPAAVANPSRTICSRSYEVRLARRAAAAQTHKLALMLEYGSPGNPSTYVVAQRVPAEDGGSPANPKNLWPMPVYGWGGALTEATVAFSLHDQICRGAITVRQAARFLKGDWLRRGIPPDD